MVTSVHSQLIMNFVLFKLVCFVCLKGYFTFHYSPTGDFLSNTGWMLRQHGVMAISQQMISCFKMNKDELSVSNLHTCL